MNLPPESSSQFPGDTARGARTPSAFVYVKIPIGSAEDPLHQREYTIDQTLREMGLGAVIGWGDSLGPVQADGTRPAAFLRIDINVSGLNEARAALRASLVELEAPFGAEIHYTLDGVNRQDTYTRSGWLLEQASA